jgi:hypothetical protein
LKHGKLFTRTSAAKLRRFAGDPSGLRLTQLGELATEHHSKRLPGQPQFSGLQFYCRSGRVTHPHAGSAFLSPAQNRLFWERISYGFATAESFLKFARFMILWLLEIAPATVFAQPSSTSAILLKRLRLLAMLVSVGIE